MNIYKCRCRCLDCPTANYRLKTTSGWRKQHVDEFGRQEVILHEVGLLLHAHHSRHPQRSVSEAHHLPPGTNLLQLYLTKLDHFTIKNKFVLSVKQFSFSAQMSFSIVGSIYSRSFWLWSSWKKLNSRKQLLKVWRVKSNANECLE